MFVTFILILCVLYQIRYAERAEHKPITPKLTMLERINKVVDSTNMTVSTMLSKT